MRYVNLRFTYLLT